ncbi:hypothetical protein Syun_022127 [Stephania yunnanensis]|uniref:Uncharacterized protein n=1 Tax=Stephania yunnanensis TaxID=152371 RepID=A0AAP0NRR4_9MAGN
MTEPPPPPPHLPDQPPKRGRGRPPKSPAPVPVSDGGPPPGKRGRGRPPKALVEEISGGGPAVVPPVIMTIGRQKWPGPPRRKRKAEGGGGGRGRGRPRKKPDLGSDGDVGGGGLDAGPTGPVVVPPVIMTVGRQKGPPARKPKKKSKRPRGRPVKPGGRKVVVRSGRPVGRPRKVKAEAEAEAEAEAGEAMEGDAQLERRERVPEEVDAPVERPKKARGRPRKVPVAAPPPPEVEPAAEESIM